MDLLFMYHKNYLTYYGLLCEVDFCAKLGLPTPKNLTQAQRSLRSVRFSSQLGCAIGLTIGCIIGMFPLLFIDAGGHHESRNKESDRTDVQHEQKKI